MNKRGQFFLIVALIICLIIFVVVVPYNTVQEKITLQDFEDLTENYEEEQPKVINKAKLEEQGEGSVERAMEEFTESFVSYARTKDPNYGVLYLIKDEEGNVLIKNFLSETVVRIESDVLEGGRGVLLSTNDPAHGSINLNVGGHIVGDGVSTDIVNYDRETGKMNLMGAENFLICIDNECLVIQTRDVVDSTFVIKSDDESGDIVKVRCSRDNVMC